MVPINNNASASFWRQEGLAILLLTVTAHAAYLAREIGYASFFSVPTNLIALSPTGLIEAAEAILFGIVAYLGKANLVWIFFSPKPGGRIRDALRFCIGLSLIVAFALYPYASLDWRVWFFMGIFLLPMAGLFVWPLITQRKKKTYAEKFDAQQDLEQSVEHATDVFIRQLDRKGLVTVAITLSIIAFAYGNGRLTAINQESFFISSERNDLALFRFYGDTGIYVVFDPESRKLSGEVVLMKISDDEVSIKKSKIGKMTGSVFNN